MERPEEHPELTALTEAVAVLEESILSLDGVAKALTALGETDAPLRTTEDVLARLATATETAHEVVETLATATAVIAERYQATQGEVLVAAAVRFVSTSGFFTLPQLRRHLEEEGLVPTDTNFRTLFRRLQPQMEEYMAAQGERVRWLRDGPRHALAVIARPAPIVEVHLPPMPPAPPSPEQQRGQLLSNMRALFGDATVLSRRELLAIMADTLEVSSGDADSQLRALAKAGILRRESRRGSLYYAIGEEQVAQPRGAAPKAPAAPAEKPAIDPPFDEQERTVAELLLDHFSSLPSGQAQRGTQQMALQRWLRRQHSGLGVTEEQYGAIIDRLVQRGYFTRTVAQGRYTQGKILKLAEPAWPSSRHTVLSKLGQPHSAQDTLSSE